MTLQAPGSRLITDKILGISQSTVPGPGYLMNLTNPNYPGGDANKVVRRLVNRQILDISAKKDRLSTKGTLRSKLTAASFAGGNSLDRVKQYNFNDAGDTIIDLYSFNN
jgi:hypothetical protein